MYVYVCNAKDWIPEQRSGGVIGYGATVSDAAINSLTKNLHNTISTFLNRTRDLHKRVAVFARTLFDVERFAALRRATSRYWIPPFGDIRRKSYTKHGYRYRCERSRMRFTMQTFDRL